MALALHSGLESMEGSSGSLLRVTASFVLSAAVPHRRWLGFTHRGLSHECRAYLSFGISPVAMRRATRLARNHVLRPVTGCRHPIIPYPWAFVAPNHGQQASGSPAFGTLAWKNAIASGMVVGMCSPAMVCDLRIPFWINPRKET